MQTIVPSQVVGVIEKLFPRVKIPEVLTLRSNQLPELRTVIGLVRQIPAELFTVPVYRYAELQLAIEIVEETTRKSQEEQYQFQIRDLGGHSVIGVIHNVLRECDDEFPVAASGGLLFIPDDLLRVNLLKDISAIESALAGGGWKAANVLAGA
jgi:hypothetical protein